MVLVCIEVCFVFDCIVCVMQKFNCEIEFVMDDKVLGVVFVMEQQDIEEIFGNFLENVVCFVKFEIWVFFVEFEQQDGCDMVEFVIEDDGLGLEFEEIKEVLKWG